MLRWWYRFRKAKGSIKFNKKKKLKNFKKSIAININHGYNVNCLLDAGVV